jgi:hypothetical protein
MSLLLVLRGALFLLCVSAGGRQRPGQLAVWRAEPVRPSAHHMVQQQLQRGGVALGPEHATRRKIWPPWQELQVCLVC